MSHTAEIIAVGTELLLGNIANTNAQMLSQSLSSLGVNVFWHTVVGDNPQRLKEALDIARRRADIILTTGGLGPTYDDLTKQTICEAFHRPLELHADIAENLRQFYRNTLHLEMPENNLQQAQLPRGCTIFDNPVGTAPGCAFVEQGVHVLMLPGPPHECQTMLHRHVEPYLRALSREVIVSHDIMTFGMGEASVDQRLHAWMASMVNPSLATYAKPSEVRLRTSAKAESRQAAEEMLAPVMAQVREALGDIIYGIDVANLENACAAALREKGWSVATAEVCTGGQLSARLAALETAQDVYRGGMVCMDDGEALLGLSLSAGQDAVSQERAIALAEAIRSRTGAHLGLSVTAAGERQGEMLVYVGLSAPEGSACRKVTTGRRHPERVRGNVSNHALDVLRRYLTNLPV